MTGALELSTYAKVLGVVRDFPLWFLTAVTTFLLVLPFLPGAGDLLTATALSWVRIAGIFFAILAMCRLGSVLTPVIQAWWMRREARRTLHLTLNDSQSFWHVTKQQDGSKVTQLSLRFMAKNRTDAPIHLLKARLIRPKLKGEVIQDLVSVRDIEGHVYGSAEITGNHIPAHGLLPASITIVIHGAPKQTTGRLKATIGVIDESGNEMRVKLHLKGMR
jgi:hypothetical protein